MTAPVNTVPPVIVATAIFGGVDASSHPIVGFTFKITSDGTWTGTTPFTLAYQWRRDGVDIPGATVRAKYVATIFDVGKMITCRVTATNVDGTGSPADSNALGPVTTYFQDEIDAVDPTKTLVFVVNTSTYTLFEFSYSGLTVTGGSQLGCEYGASWLLDAMGFRWYAAAPWGTVRPTSINVGLTKAKSEHWMPTNSIGLTYGHSWPAPWSADAGTLNNRNHRWLTLNGFAVSVYPAGSRWGTIVTNNKGFFANYPHLLKSGNPNDLAPKYDLPNITPTGTPADWDRLVQLNAAYLLFIGLNDWKRTNFDPADGDDNTSDNVLRLTKAVAELMQIGTPAISWPAVTLNGINYPAGGIAAQAGVLGCEIGIYAYAGHKAPPSFDCKPHVYSMVALAFSLAGFHSYQDLVAAFTAKVLHVLLREYWDTETFSHSLPLTNGRMKQGYFDWYDDFHASGVIGMYTEYTSNSWLNLVGVRYGMQKCKTGAGTYDDALDDVMAKLFSPGGVEDAGMRDLYDYWGNPSNRFNRLTLRISCDKIAALPTSWYKTFLQQWMIIAYKRMYLPTQTRYKAKVSDLPMPVPPAAPNVVGSFYVVREFDPYRVFTWNGTAWVDSGVAPFDPYPDAYSDYMADVVGTRLDEVIHSYAMARQDGRTYINVNYPALGFEKVPPPEYYTNPTVFTPTSTNAEFAAAHAQLLLDTPHDPDLDDDDLVLIRGIRPVTYPTVYPQSSYFGGRYVGAFVFVGPGKVIISELIGGVIGPTSEVTETSYGPGAHFVTSEYDYWAVSNEGGELFMDTLGGMWQDPYEGPTYPPHWLYVHKKATEAVPHTVTMETGVRWTFYDRNDAGAIYRLDLIPKNSAPPSIYIPPTDLGPGQILVDTLNTRGDINNTGVNRWLSKKADVVLLPKPIADYDFPKMARVVVAP